MARLIYSAITSLDGYVADAGGGFGWAEPDAEVHAFVNSAERTVGTYLYGRRMYEVMTYWETAGGLDQRDISSEYADIWRAADKVVYSRTLQSVGTSRTTLRSEFNPDEVRSLAATAAGDISIGGPALAAHAIKAGLVDEYNVYLNPIVVGGGTAWLPDGALVTLELVAEHRFSGGVVHLCYRSRG